MKETMKFCKNCKYIKDVKVVDLCTHPYSTYATNLVTGEPIHQACFRMRWEDGKCGPTGKLFKPSLWYRIKNEFKITC
jgi:hypothetical protein